MAHPSLLGAPVGFVPRVETSREQLAFIRESVAFPWVMLDVDRAARLVTKGLSADALAPQGRVVTTTTIQDAKLAQFHLDREVEVVSRFRPAWHVPCDRPVYREDSPLGRRGLIDDQVRSTVALAEALEGTSVGVMPLVKGVNSEEWLRSYRPLADRGFTHFACYVKQYFGGGQGRRLDQMIEHVRGVVSTCDMPYLLLIGYQSMSRLGDLPPQVRGFAGQRWLHQTRISELAPGLAENKAKDFVDRGRAASHTRQSVIEGSWGGR